MGSTPSAAGRPDGLHVHPTNSTICLIVTVSFRITRGYATLTTDQSDIILGSPLSVLLLIVGRNLIFSDISQLCWKMYRAKIYFDSLVLPTAHHVYFCLHTIIAQSSLNVSVAQHLLHSIQFLRGISDTERFASPKAPCRYRGYGHLSQHHIELTKQWPTWYQTR